MCVFSCMFVCVAAEPAGGRVTEGRLGVTLTKCLQMKAPNI